MKTHHVLPQQGKKITRKRIITFLITLSILFGTCAVVSADSTYTATEIKAAEKVQYISNREFFYYEQDNVYVIRFCFKDKDENKIASSCKLEARLVNAKGEEVYSVKTDLSMNEDFSTWTWNSSLYSDRNGIYGTYYIKPEAIKKSSSSTGKMYIQVTLPDNSYFKESEVDIDELPTIDPTLKTPQLPKVITSYSGKRAVKITEISYEFDKHSYDDESTLYVYITAEMTKGSTSTAQSAQIAWRLLDHEGYVVDSGNWYTDKMTVGEKFKKKKFTIFNVEIGDYTLELRNV